MNNKEDEKLQDAYLMGQQDMVYKIIQEFLDTETARKFGVTGIDVKLEDGFVNASWKFGERKENDIIR